MLCVKDSYLYRLYFLLLSLILNISGCSLSPKKSTTVINNQYENSEIIETKTIVPILGLTEWPRVLNNIQPIYPSVMKEKLEGGEVRVLISLDFTGSIESTKTLFSTNEYFESSALRAISQLKFKPAYIDDVAVKSQITRIYKYKH